MKVKRMD